MSKVLVTGMAGTGKSSALAELGRRGYRVVDTDDPGWCKWVESSDEDGPWRVAVGRGADGRTA
jgi:predicted ATPase